MMVDKITAETPHEAQIMADPRWQRGAAWGEPRPGHPEGVVSAHIADVLANIEALGLASAERMKLRLVALIHDTFKNEVDERRPRSGENHHAMIARRFAEQYTAEADVLELIELHDEAYNAWTGGQRSGAWSKAEARARRLIDRLGFRLPLYLHFYRADNATGDKAAEPLRWFERLALEGAAGG